MAGFEAPVKIINSPMSFTTLADVALITHPPVAVPVNGVATSSGPNCGVPFLVSGTSPIGSPTAVQGVVPALSWYRFASVLKSHRPPASPAAKSLVGLNGAALADAPRRPNFWKALNMAIRPRR